MMKAGHRSVRALSGDALYDKKLALGRLDVGQLREATRRGIFPGEQSQLGLRIVTQRKQHRVASITLNLQMICREITLRKDVFQIQISLQFLTAR